MKLYEVAAKVATSGEQVLGSQETGSHACYLIYGVLLPGEKKREIKPGHGHEEILLAVRNDLQCTGHFEGVLRQGQALHLKEEEAVLVLNNSKEKAVYVISGGHAGSGHAHH